MNTKNATVRFIVKGVCVPTIRLEIRECMEFTHSPLSFNSLNRLVATVYQNLLQFVEFEKIKYSCGQL